MKVRMHKRRRPGRRRELLYRPRPRRARHDVFYFHLLVFHREIVMLFPARMWSEGHSFERISHSEHPHAIQNNSSGLLRATWRWISAFFEWISQEDLSHTQVPSWFGGRGDSHTRVFCLFWKTPVKVEGSVEEKAERKPTDIYTRPRLALGPPQAFSNRISVDLSNYQEEQTRNACINVLKAPTCGSTLQFWGTQHRQSCFPHTQRSCLRTDTVFEVAVAEHNCFRSEFGGRNSGEKKAFFSDMTIRNFCF